MTSAIILGTDDIILTSRCGNHTYPAALVLDIQVTGKRKELEAYADGREGIDAVSGDFSVRYEYEVGEGELGTLWVRKSAIDAFTGK